MNDNISRKCQTCGNELPNVSRQKFCNRVCFGLSRRKTIEEKKATKAAYDKKIYATPERREARKRYFQKSYKSNPEKYREIRKLKYESHLEYINTPKYKEWKKEYDKKRFANKNYGAFAEASIVLSELEIYLKQNAPAGFKFQMGITNKTQKRQRLWRRKNKNLQQQT